MFIKAFCILIFTTFFWGIESIFSQNIVVFKNNEYVGFLNNFFHFNPKMTVLKEGKNIIYMLKSDQKIINGVLNRITDSTLVIGNIPHHVNEFRMIGFRTNRKLIAQLIGVPLFILGGIYFGGEGLYLLVTGLYDLTVQGIAPDLGLLLSPLFLANGIGSINYGIKLFYKNKYEFYIDSKWELEIVDKSSFKKLKQNLQQ